MKEILNRTLEAKQAVHTTLKLATQLGNEENLYKRRLSMVVVKRHNKLASWVLDDLRKTLGKESTFNDNKQ